MTSYESLAATVAQLVDFRGRQLITQTEYLAGLRRANRAYAAAKRHDLAARQALDVITGVEVATS